MKDFFQRAAQRAQREILLERTSRKLRVMSEEIARMRVSSEKDHPVILFNASTRLENLSQNAGFSLVTGLALQVAGIPIVQFVCEQGLKPCVLGTWREDVHKNPPCAKCLKTSHKLFSHCETKFFKHQPNTELEEAISGLNLDELLHFEFHGNKLGEKVLPSLRWILRRHHLEDDENNRWLTGQYIVSAWNVFTQFKALIKEEKPRAVVLFNGMFYPEAMAREAAREENIPVFTHEVGMLPLSAFFTDGEATAYPVTIDNSFKLDSKMEKMLDDYLAERRRGDFVTAGVQFWPEMLGLNEDLQSKINSHAQMVPIFTNVVFDTSQSHANVVFEHMFTWLDTVLEQIDLHPETLFILRAHPDELRSGKESRQTVAEWVKARRTDERENVIFIPSDTYISSYELVDRAKFVMVYNSTIGLEAAASGKAVLCGGKARYTQVPTVFFPQSRDAFIQKMDDLVRKKTIQVPDEFQINAKRVLYSQLFRASLPFGDFLENDGIWRGYVQLKDFSVNDLSIENSKTMRVLLDGILNLNPFLLEE